MAASELTSKETLLCHRCERILPLSAFVKGKKCRVHSPCRECNAAALAEYKARYAAQAPTIWAAQTPEILISTFKTCRKCRQSKPLGEFSRMAICRDGRNSQCNSCESERHKKQHSTDEGREKRRLRMIQWRADNSLYSQRCYTMRYFGTEPAETMQFVGTYLAEHGPHCSSCGRECVLTRKGKFPGKARLVLDHCHKTGRLRSMLCEPCNKALGTLEDSPEKVRKLLAYIEGHS